MSEYSNYAGSKEYKQELRFGEANGSIAEDNSGNNKDGAYEGSVALGEDGLVTGDSDTAILLNDGDLHFGSVVSLQHFDGADGSTTMTDVIPGVTWTAAGTAQLDTYWSAFGPSSLQCSGDGSYLYSSNAPNLDAATYTIDFWVRLDPGTRENVNQAIISKWGATEHTNSYLLLFISSSTSNAPNKLAFHWRAGATTYVANEIAHAFAFNQDYFIEINRSDDALRFLVDGVLIGTIACVNTHNQNSEDTRIGNAQATTDSHYLHGRVDDLRITNGAARHTANYNIPSKAAPNEQGSRVNLGPISVFANAGTLGYDMRHAFKPTLGYNGSTANEVLLDKHDGTNGILVEYETGNLQYTHGSETKSIAVTFDAGEIYRHGYEYNASTKLLEVYSNGTLLGSHTFTNELIMPNTIPYRLGGQRTIDEWNYKEGHTTAEDIAEEYTAFHDFKHLEGYPHKPDGFKIEYNNTSGAYRVTHNNEYIEFIQDNTLVKRRVITYNASTKVLNFFVNGSLLGTHTFTGDLVTPTEGDCIISGTRTIDTFSVEAGATTLEDVVVDNNYFV